MNSRKIVLAAIVLNAGYALSSVQPADAQPSIDQVISEVGLSADVKQRVLNGEFVTTDVKGVADTDLSIAIAFLVKTSPEALSKDIISGTLIGTDPQVQSSGEFTGAGSLADLAKLKISGDEAQKLAKARAGEDLNLSSAEIAAFNALKGGTTEAVEEQLRRMLLARFQAYKKSGLAGIAPYDRGGSSTDVGAELRKASDAASAVKKYLPSFHQVLTGYPQGSVPGMQEDFHWVKYDISGTTTFALTHTLAAADGAARAVVQRQYYVSTGYNAEQAVAGLLPVQEGTFVAYSNHTFTDQVEGFGGSMKRGIGRKMMAGKLEDVFKKARNEVAR